MEQRISVPKYQIFMGGKSYICNYVKALGAWLNASGADNKEGCFSKPPFNSTSFVPISTIICYLDGCNVFIYRNIVFIMQEKALF